MRRCISGFENISHGKSDRVLTHRNAPALAIARRLCAIVPCTCTTWIYFGMSEKHELRFLMKKCYFLNLVLKLQ